MLYRALPGFRLANSARFVEVDPECNLITAK